MERRSLRRMVTAMGLAAAFACAPALGSPADAARLLDLLQNEFLAGVEHRVVAAEAPDGGPIGFVVEVPVGGGGEPDAAERAARTQAKLTAQALALATRAFPGRPVAPWSTVLIGSPLPAPPPAGLGGLAPVLGAIELPAGNLPAEDPDGPGSPARVAAASIPTRLADRLRRELAPNYPDARVEVIGRGPRRVEIWVTVLTGQPSSANGHYVVDFVRRVVETVTRNEFRGVEILGGPNIGVRPIERPDEDDLPRRDRGVAHSRPPQGQAGLSRRLEGRLRQELSTRYPTVEAKVSFITNSEAMFEVRVESPGHLTKSNRLAVREYLRRTVLTILANEHPSIVMSARSRFTVWTKVRLPVEPRKPRIEKTVVTSAPLVTSRPRVVELPTAHVMHAGHRQAEVTAFRRSVKDGLFDNVVRLEQGALDLTYRQGLVRGLEMAITYRGNVLGAGIRDPSTFTGASRGIGVLTGSLKFLPFRYNGMELAAGVTQSLVSDLDRPHFLPDDWERFANGFVVFSSPFAPGWRTHLALLRSMIPASGSSGSTSSTVAGVGIEWLPFEGLRLCGELVSQTLEGGRVGELGRVVSVDGESAFDNVHGNASVSMGFHSIGDVTIYGRKLDREIDREMGLSLFKKF